MTAETLLNLSQLQLNGDVSKYSPLLHIGRVTETFGAMRISRRGLLQLVAATAFGPALEISGQPRDVVVVANESLLRVLIDKVDRWIVDCKKFSGRPRILHSIGPDESLFELVGAYFPGTDVPASFSGRIWRTPFGWQTRIKLIFGGFDAEVPLFDWLVNGIPAKSRIEIPKTIHPFEKGSRLVLHGTGSASLSPNWTIQIEGRSVARFIGDGADLGTDNVQICLLEKDDSSVINPTANRRCLMSLDGVDRNWKWPLTSLPHGPWRLHGADGTFDIAQIEFSELSDQKRCAALVLRATESKPTMTLEASEGLRGLDGSRAEFTLHRPRYACVFKGRESESAFLADWHGSPTWAQAGDVALEFGGGSSTAPFEIRMRNGMLEDLRAARSLLRAALPVSSPEIAAGPISICDSPEVRFEYPGSPGFFERLKCWLHLCNKNQLCIPLHGSKLPVLRHADLLRLDFEFINLAVQSVGGELSLVRTDWSGKPADESTDDSALPESLLIVHFPSQNVYEQAFYEGVVASGIDCDPDSKNKVEDKLKKPPVAARISGPSRLAFYIRERRTPYSLESLLNFGRLEMKVVSTAVPGGERPSVDLKPVKPGARDTAIEVPYRLLLSPNRFAGWANTRKDVRAKNGEWTELWHTRLGVRHDGTVDEQEIARRTLRAVWSEDYSEDPCLPPQENIPFRSTLTKRDRIELVELTSNFALDDPSDDQSQPLKRRPYRPDPISAESLMLSSLGAWLKSTGQWRPPLNRRGQALTVELWKHIATLGRDQYVRVEYKGYLLPLGIPCTLVKVTERKFDTIDSIDGKIAYLKQRLFIVIKREEKNYPATGQQHDGRAWPFVKVHFEKNFTTPTLKEPDDRSEFWPQTQSSAASTPQDILFRYRLECVDGTVLDVVSPLKFVDATVAFSECTADDLSLAQGRPCESNAGARCGVIIPAHDRLGCAIDEYNSYLNHDRRMVSLNARKVAYAPSKKPGDTQLETNTLLLSVERSSPKFTCRNLFALDQAPIYPAIESADVHLTSISELTGAPADTTIEYSDLYLDQGFSDGANRGEVFAAITGKPVAITFGGTSANGDKAGGIVTPNAAIAGLSRRIGPVGGASKDSLDVTASATFDPSSFFANALSEAKILGGIRLADIIRPFAEGVADALDKAPKVLRRALSSVEATLEKEAVLFHDEAAKLQKLFQDGIAQVDVLKARFQPQVDVIARDISSLQAAIDNKPQPNDDFAALSRDEKLVEIQGTIVNDFRSLAAEVDDTVRHPQALLNDEVALLLQKATDFLATALAPSVQKLLTWAQSSLDRVVDGLIRSILDATANLTHCSQWRTALEVARQNLLGAVQNLTKTGSLEETLVKIANVIDCVNRVRGEIRRVSDLGSLAVSDLNAFKAGARDLAGAVPSDFQAQRAALEAAFNGLPSTSLTAQQAETAVFGDLAKVEASWKNAQVDATALFAAQSNLIRSVKSLLLSVDRNSAAYTQLAKILLPWIDKFTSITSATDDKLQKVSALFQGGTTAAAQLVRVQTRAKFFVDSVSGARQVLFANGANPQNNLDGVIELLDRVSKAEGFLEEAIDVLPLDAATRQKLKELADILNTLVTQVKGNIDEVKAIVDAMRELQKEAPYILQAILKEEIDELSAPLLDYANALEQQAIGIISTVLSNAGTFVVDLLKKLDIPPDKLNNVLDLAANVAQLLATLLVPQAIELSYTFNPVLKDSPGGVFELVPDANGALSDGKKNLLIQVRVRTYIQAGGGGKAPEYEIKGRLERFKVNLLQKREELRFITIEFSYLEFNSTNGSSPHCNVRIKDITFGQALAFVKKLAELLNPADGPYLILSPSQLVAGFRFAFPDKRTGGFSLKNLRFDASITLPFTGEPARFKFAISSRDNPFIVSVGIYGGGGWFSISIGVDGVDETELALEFGLAGDISIGIATGYGRLMAGIYIHYKKGVGTELTGFIDIAGHVDVLGLISLSLSIYYGLRRLPSGQCFGEADITVKIEMFCFDVEVHLHTEKQFAGDSASSDMAAQLYASKSWTSLAPLTDKNCYDLPPNTKEEETEDRELDWDAFLEAFEVPANA
jgi:hypothetical protein